MIELENGKSCLWQWNTQQRAFTDYPAGTKFDFAQSGTDVLERTAYTLGNQTVVDIPNALLQLAGTLYVYAHKIADGQLTTVLEASIPVRSQPKPRNYVNDEEEVLIWHSLEERIIELEQNGTGPGGPSDAVRYGPQDLSEKEKEQARKNIGASAAPEPLKLIERHDLTGLWGVQKTSGPTGSSDDINAVSLVADLGSEALDATITVKWSDASEFVFRFSKERLLSVYLECRGGMIRGNYGVGGAAAYAQPVASTPSNARIKTVGLALSGPAGDAAFLEIRGANLQ